jgi:hypothetical protein
VGHAVNSGSSIATPNRSGRCNLVGPVCPIRSMLPGKGSRPCRALREGPGALGIAPTDATPGQDLHRSGRSAGTAALSGWSAHRSLVRACWQMMWLGLLVVTVGSDVVTVACRAGHEDGLLVVEEYHLPDRPEARGCLSTLLRPRRPVAVCRDARVTSVCRAM